MSDSVFHVPKFTTDSFKDMGVLTEALWMIYNKDDKTEIPKMLNSLKNLSLNQYNLIDYVANCNKNTIIKSAIIKKNTKKYIKSLQKVDLTSSLIKNTKTLLDEVNELLKLVERGELTKVKKFIKKAKYLFRGAAGVRHVDFVAHKRS